MKGFRVSIKVNYQKKSLFYIQSINHKQIGKGCNTRVTSWQKLCRKRMSQNNRPHKLNNESCPPQKFCRESCPPQKLRHDICDVIWRFLEPLDRFLDFNESGNSARWRWSRPLPVPPRRPTHTTLTWLADMGLSRSPMILKPNLKIYLKYLYKVQVLWESLLPAFKTAKGQLSEHRSRPTLNQFVNWHTLVLSTPQPPKCSGDRVSKKLQTKGDNFSAQLGVSADALLLWFFSSFSLTYILCTT